ncbi:O-antigen ligase family protein [Thiohalophilus sp.]|uniref:O-antigen ligase family protein n=1 Tax=Thiohalophilus sp. TaxID=3028392 RepID=UPI002ACDA506|nr:O-antigen ligase family protein [Thiohalophilus sp.]MDZ7803402.1 O-antigen ligase family protein [Thiohalophilus sp.]
MNRLFPAFASSRVAILSTFLFLTAFIAALIFNGFYLQYYSLAQLALFAWLLLALLHGYHRHHTLVITPLTIVVGLFFAFLAVSLIYHPVPYLGVMNLWWVGVFALIVAIYLLLPEAEQTWRYSFNLLMVIITGLALWGFGEQLLYDVSPDASFYNKNSLAALINLALLPLAARYLTSEDRRRSRYSIATALVILAFVLGLISSRGALLAFAVGLIVLVYLLWQPVSRQQLAALGAWLASGFVLATLYTQLTGFVGRDMFSRMATLADPGESGNPRFMLWQPAWEMLQAQPFSGIGLGAFFLKLPTSAHLEDTSAGYYVHNDYLQIATETGLPGLFFLLLIIGVLIWQFVRLARRYRARGAPTTTDSLQSGRSGCAAISSSSSPVYFEAVGLFSALLAFGLHSAFTYNFYVLPLMIVAGLYLARLDRLFAQHSATPTWRFTWKSHFHPLSFYLVSFAIVLMAAGYFVTLALSDHYHQKGNALAATGRLQQAHFAYERAQQLSPYMDNHFYADADLLLRSVAVLPPESPKRDDLLDYAADKLDRAAELNAYQAYTPYLQGRLQELRDADTYRIIDDYRQALQNNPRFLPARLALARVYQRREQPEQAFAILQAGLDYPYHSLSRELLDYVQLTAEIATQTGHDELATQLQQRLEQFRQAYAQQSKQGQRRPSQRY